MRRGGGRTIESTLMNKNDTLYHLEIKHFIKQFGFEWTRIMLN